MWSSLLLAWVVSFSVIIRPLALTALSTQLLNQQHSDIEIDNNNSTKKDLRIIGGIEAMEDRYIYTVSLQDGNFAFCGGSLILRDVVLTAAHCLNGGNNFQVVIGRHDLTDNGGERISVKQTYIHPLYRDHNYDFALVILSSPVQDDNIQLITLNNDNAYPNTGTIAHVMGWGDTDPGSAVVTVKSLQIASVEVISNDECESFSINGQNYQGKIDESMLCTYTEGKDACQGDSGGPLIVRGNEAAEDVQIGIVSWGSGCAYFPGVFSRVSIVYDWIEDNACSKSSDTSGSSLCTTIASKLPSTWASNESPRETSPPSVAPFRSPTKEPTLPPSENPTIEPTLSPSAAPTIEPTSSPSEVPTIEPTSSPSEAPTIEPTSSPSEAPTIEPTSSPSAAPSRSPTNEPTEPPSDAPSNSPTRYSPENQKSLPGGEEAPTTSPTFPPSTAAPTKAPSQIPSRTPTRRPTLIPSELPSAQPSKRPSTDPTFLLLQPSAAQVPDVPLGSLTMRRTHPPSSSSLPTFSSAPTITTYDRQRHDPKNEINLYELRDPLVTGVAISPEDFGFNSSSTLRMKNNTLFAMLMSCVAATSLFLY